MAGWLILVRETPRGEFGSWEAKDPVTGITQSGWSKREAKARLKVLLKPARSSDTLSRGGKPEILYDR